MTETIDIQREVAERAGCRSITRARSTGTLVGIYDARARRARPRRRTVGDAPARSTPASSTTRTLALARAFASEPETWCEFCRPIAEERALPAELRESEAYAADREGASKLWDNGFRPMLGERAPRRDVRGVRRDDVRLPVVVRPSALPASPASTRSARATSRGASSSSTPGGNPAEVDEAEEVWAQ